MAAFVILRDHLDKKAVRVIGPSTATINEIERLDSGLGFGFRLLDDDGGLYYSGRFLGDPNSEDAFMPLDCYGTPNAGCTVIQYRNSIGEWGDL